MKIEVSVPAQTLRLYNDAGGLQKEYPCSTSRFGYSSEPGSNHTPLGKFRVSAMIGRDAEPGTIFRSRLPEGLWDGQPADDDYVLTRILWLDGLEEHNANTRDRYIYIHGTNQEQLIGTQASHGCIRLTNADVIDLFNRVQEGVEVEILA
ncbi:MAG TPA: L,D-transpeptidase [Verrucomicrobiales bacterium]|jgi:lipoprotein-anchoring transpeptidase ErfK/SrfK|nr:L,D-transpeptidase [Verrucomicrobiales bacterium]